MRPLQTEFHFAGFSWPRYVGMLPRGSFAERIRYMRNPITGGYYHSPTPNWHGERSFYLASDFAPGLRWKWADKVSGARIQHTGWFADECQDTKVRGVVFRLPHGRGFLAGWSMGEHMASAVNPHDVYDDEADAACAADGLAENIAEAERDYRDNEGEC